MCSRTKEKARGGRDGLRWAEESGWASFSLFPFFSEFFSSSFCHRISGKERIKIGKGLGRFQKQIAKQFLKCLQITIRKRRGGIL
jgi:hypothetical protein